MGSTIGISHTQSDATTKKDYTLVTVCLYSSLLNLPARSHGRSMTDNKKLISLVLQDIKLVKI